MCEEPGRHAHRYVRKHRYVRNGVRGRDDGSWQDIVPKAGVCRDTLRNGEVDLLCCLLGSGRGWIL